MIPLIDGMTSVGFKVLCLTIDTKEWEERISLEKVEEGFFVKSKIANPEYHTNNMNLKILILTLICIP